MHILNQKGFYTGAMLASTNENLSITQYLLYYTVPVIVEIF